MTSVYRFRGYNRWHIKILIVRSPFSKNVNPYSCWGGHTSRRQFTVMPRTEYNKDYSRTQNLFITRLWIQKSLINIIFAFRRAYLPWGVLLQIFVMVTDCKPVFVIWSLHLYTISLCCASLYNGCPSTHNAPHLPYSSLPWQEPRF